MKIPSLQNYPRRQNGAYFYDLTPEQRASARQWLNKFISRRRAKGQSVPPWLRGILVGQARRLALNPPTSAWGRSMRAKKGGLAAQARYRAEGRDPLAAAKRARDRKRKRAAEDKDASDDFLGQVSDQDLSPIYRTGLVSAGLNGRHSAEMLQKEISEALSRALALDCRFGEHLGWPKEDWTWELRLVPTGR